MKVSLLNETDLHPSNSPFTVLESEQKQIIIEHMNEDHFEDLAGFVKAFTTFGKVSSKEIDVQLLDIYAEGFSLQVSKLDPSNEPNEGIYEATGRTDQAGQSDQSFKTENTIFFIAFPETIASLEELQYQYILVKQQADKKLHKKTIKLTEQIFNVENHFHVTDNMYRLVLTPNEANNSTKATSLPYNEPGYAYLFDLEHNFASDIKTDTDTNVTINKDSSTGSKSKRLHRYYTLRQAWQDPKTGLETAWIDVFLHGETLGSQWLDTLDLGMTVKTKREVPEKIAHLNQGQVLLIADETSIPTVVRLLELWQNPIAPLIIYITNNECDQDYLYQREPNNLIDDHLNVIPLVIEGQQQGLPLAQFIDQTLEQYLIDNKVSIEKVWGAIEVGTSKALRALLKTRLGLDRSDMIVKGYWRQE